METMHNVCSDGNVVAIIVTSRVLEDRQCTVVPIGDFVLILILILNAANAENSMNFIVKQLVLIIHSKYWIGVG